MKRMIACLAVLVMLGFGRNVLAAGAECEAQTPSGSWSGVRDAMAGEQILCRSTLTMPAEGEGVYACRLSRGLSFVSVTQVLRDGEAINAAFYTVVTARQEETAFTLYISPLAAPPGERLTAEFILSVNDSAERENRFSLAPVGESGQSGCIRCFSLTALRASILPETGQQYPVSGACLCLSRDRLGQDRLAFRQRGEDSYLACTADDCPHARHLYVLKTPRNGRVYLEGLSAGTYYLCETRPAEGLNVTAESVELVLTPEGKLWADGVLCPDSVAVMRHNGTQTNAEERSYTLMDFYRRGSELLAMGLLALLAARRYYI